MCSTLLAKNVDTLDPAESETLEYVKREIEEIVDVKNEPMLVESIPNKFYNEESEYSIDQIINESGNVWSKEDDSTTWNSDSEDFNAENYSTVHIFSKLGVKNELNEMKVEEVTEESHLIGGKNQDIQNENIECTMIKVEDVSETQSSIQQELIIQEKCGLTCMDSVKTENSEDINAKEDSKYIINQIIDENGKVWPKEDFLSSWNFHSIKMEGSEDFNSKPECTTTKGKSEMLSSILMAPSPPKSELPKNSNIYSKHMESSYYKCNLCDYRSSQKVSLQNHLKASHVKLINFKCDSCDYSSSRKSILQRHINAIHLKLKNHKCNLCNHSSSQKVRLQQHINSVHLKIRNHKCNLCDYRSSKKDALQEHINSVHLKLKNHKCDFCDYSSSRNGVLQRHIKAIHLNLKNHKCNLCDYSSSRKGHLRNHIKATHFKIKNHNL